MNNIDSLREAVAYLRATKLSRGLTAREYKNYAGYKRELAIAEWKYLKN